MGAEELAEVERKLNVGIKALDQSQGDAADTEPAAAFLNHLRESVASGRAHLTAPNGGKPDCEGSWGWLKDRDGGVDSVDVARGHSVGWVDGTNTYLRPQAAINAANAVVADGTARTGIGEGPMGARLNERGLLKSRESNRNTYKIRRTFCGSMECVWHLETSTFTQGLNLASGDDDFA